MSGQKWIRSGRCEANACVEAANTPDGVVLMRNNQRPGTVTFSAPLWTTFLADVRSGRFDLEELRAAAEQAGQDTVEA